MLVEYIIIDVCNLDFMLSIKLLTLSEALSSTDILLICSTHFPFSFAKFNLFQSFSSNDILAELSYLLILIT